MIQYGEKVSLLIGIFHYQRESKKAKIDSWDAEWKLTEPGISDVKTGEEKTLDGKMSGRSSYIFGIPIYTMS